MVRLGLCWYTIPTVHSMERDRMRRREGDGHSKGALGGGVMEA